MLFITILADLSVEEKDFVLRIYEDYGDYMYKEAYKILRNEHDAADAVQDAMVKIIKFIAKFEGNTGNEIRNKVVICIRSTIRRKAIDHYNINKKRYAKETDFFVRFYDDDETRESEPEDENADIEQIVITKEVQEAVQKAILQLPTELQDAINLVYYCDFSCVEAAKFLGITDNALRNRLYRARKKLKEMLRGDFGEFNEK